MAGLSPREEVLILRMFDMTYIKMNYTDLQKLSGKVQWDDIEKKYGGIGGFHEAVGRLFHFGLAEDHGKSGEVASLSSKGCDYARYLRALNRYPEESNPAYRALSLSRNMKWYASGPGWNGRDSRWAVANDAEFERIFQKSEQIGNIQAELLAMKEALEVANEGDEICTDSESTIAMLTDKSKPKEAELKPLYEACIELARRKKPKLTVVGKEDNKARRLLRSRQ